MTTLADEAIQFKPGGHVCHLYETFAEQREVVVRFFQDGLNDGEHCLYITALQSPEDWYATFSGYGIDVGRHRQRGALNVIDGAFWRGIGDMNSIVKAREALGLINSLLDEFNGVRIAGDAAWALNPPALPVDQLCHMEATLNLVYEGWNARAICQYDLGRHSASGIETALRTHPLAIASGKLRINPYNETRRILANEPHLNQPQADEKQVRKMIDRLLDN